VKLVMLHLMKSRWYIHKNCSEWCAGGHWMECWATPKQQFTGSRYVL